NRAGSSRSSVSCALAIMLRTWSRMFCWPRTTQNSLIRSPGASEASDVARAFSVVSIVARKRSKTAWGSCAVAWRVGGLHQGQPLFEQALKNLITARARNLRILAHFVTGERPMRKQRVIRLGLVFVESNVL